jgi:23S rRNA pseudouridine1911/1915/1917 synthase
LKDRGLPRLVLARNFLHAAELEFAHPRTGERLSLVSNLPADLKNLMAQLAPSRAVSGNALE